MDKKTLIAEVAQDTGVTKSEVGIIIESFLINIVNSVRDGDIVYLRGFGSFLPVQRKEKSVWNFRTKKNYRKEGYICPKFKPYKTFINIVNNGSNKE